MIPKIVHFIFGLRPDFGNKEFSYIHYLSVITAAKNIKPEKIIFHYQYKPSGFWWERTKKFVTLNEVEAPDHIFGNKLNAFQHKADVLRLQILKNMGGIYLDMDIVVLNSFDDLLQHKNVMGIEPSQGLCNAVILCETNSLFIDTWYNSYRTFQNNKWNYHSIKMPFNIAQTMQNEIEIVDYYSFFYPFYKDNAQYYLWGVKHDHKKMFDWLTKDILLKFYRFLPFSDSRYVPIFHQLKPIQWHYEKMKKSYCIHLWETIWWDKYLKNITPDTILDENKNLFSKLIVSRLTENEIRGSV